MTDVKALAAWFVEFAKRHAKHDESTAFADEALKKMFDIVSAAGFEPSAVAVGTLVGNRYMNGEYEGTYKVNPHSPFKVIGEDGKDHWAATRWLNCLWELVNPQLLFRVANNPDELTALVDRIRREIERSAPFKPILIGPDGELLCESYPPSYGHFVDHKNDESNIFNYAGVHKYCGEVERKRVSATHDALVCRGCYLRVTFPSSVKTFGELRVAMAQLARNKWRWPRD